NAYRPIDLAAPAEQVPEREVGLERLVVDLRDLDEKLERLVCLAVQHEVQAAEIVRADPGRRRVVAFPAQAVVCPPEPGEDDQDRGKDESGFSRHRAAAVYGDWPPPPRSREARASSAGDRRRLGAA